MGVVLFDELDVGSCHLSHSLERLGRDAQTHPPGIRPRTTKKNLIPLCIPLNVGGFENSGCQDTTREFGHLWCEMGEVEFLQHIGGSRCVLCEG